MRGVRVLERERRADARGWLQKVLARSDLDPGGEFGEVYVVSAEPGEARGNHLHRRMGEYFAVVSGRGEVVAVDPETGERIVVPLGEDLPRTVYVGPGLAHAVVNTGAVPMVAVAWAEGDHDPGDVFPYPVSSRT